MATKNDNKTMPMLIGAIALGLFAALCSVFYLHVRENSLKEQYAQDQMGNVAVVVAKRNLPKGTQVTPEYFGVFQMPVDYVHDDAVAPGEFDRYIGRSLTANLSEGRTLLKSFMEADFPVDFSDIIPKGHRAMTISVDDINSIGGHLRPGNRVDLFVNIPFKLDTKQVAAALASGFSLELPPQITDMIPPELIAQIDNAEALETILAGASPSDLILPVIQNVRVLATGKDPYEETLDSLRQPQRSREAHFSTITLDVDVEQAGLLTLAIDKGEIFALLRNRGDESASDFTYVAPRDLLSNASDMAAAEKERASRVAEAAGVDINGNLVDADGKTLVSAEQLAAAGYTVNENGQIVDKDGNIIDPSDIIVAADGTMMTKQQLAAAGLTVNASGQIIDKDGNVVSADNIVMAADGTMMTKQQLAAAGLSVNANGEIVDANGKVVSPDDIIVRADGTIISRQQLEAAGLTAAAGVDATGNLVDASGNVLMSKEQLAAAGYSVNEKGQIVDKDGNVVDPQNILVDKDGNIVDPNNIIVAADGSVLTKAQLEAAGITAAAGVDATGNLVDSSGNVLMSKEQLAAAGYTVNEKGQIVDRDGNVIDPKNILVDKDGNIVSPNDIVIASDGSVMTKAQLAAAGLTINENGEIVDKNGNIVDPDDLITSADGTVLSKKALAAQGLSVNANGEIVNADGRVLSREEIAAVAENMTILGATQGSKFQLIIGGSSEDGVAKSLEVNVKSNTPPAEE